eukprot:NODE_1596_length_1119_cov_89.204673_g1301_i0.p2 GENE.NODE_1596_length_1119_cov_89.204673_g1301_i0~~NODE_1596_length_1119_cov_89.204673_g1301_i0.p2  ORF type:complete len:102 (+),score=28.90 NODE_1596_length_1119_cov_89.204673_g1301_i0:739-1044(+)
MMKELKIPFRRGPIFDETAQKEETEQEKQARIRAEFCSCLKTKLKQHNEDFMAESRYYLGETDYNLLKALNLFEEDLRFEKEQAEWEQRNKGKKGKKSKVH